MLNSVEQWDDFYKQNPQMEPSSFSKFAIGTLYLLRSLVEERRKMKIVDVGCGNGRDSVALIPHAKSLGIGEIVCLDVSSEAIQCTRNNIPSMATDIPVRTVCQDITEYDFSGVDICYCRFLLHTLDEGSFQKFLKSLKSGTLLLAETRVIPYNEDHEKHPENNVYVDGKKERRILTDRKLDYFLEERMEIECSLVGQFSPCGDDNPNLLRTVGTIY